MNPLWLVVAAVGLLAYGTLAVAAHRIDRHGFLLLAWRFFTGHPWHGKPVTDAGWVRPGTRALTRTGHASRFHHRPRWQRTMMRTAPAAGFVATLYGLLADRTATVRGLAGFTAVAAVAGIVRLVQAWRLRQHHRKWVRPLHNALSGKVGVPLPNRPQSWLAVRLDRSEATLTLPPRYAPDTNERNAIVSTAAAKLGMDAPDVAWHMAGPRPQLALTASKPPPERVGYEQMLDALADTGDDELLAGIGRRDLPVTISLDGDSPHIGASMASGAGKSVMARLFTAQVLHHGGLAVILDIKRISHPWAKGLPNVAYAKDVEEIHETLLLLVEEMNRRNYLADEHTDIEGHVRVDVGPRLFVVCEELNATQIRLRQYWASIRNSEDPRRSPASEALDQLMFVGRQVKMNALMIAQRLSAAASGSGDARENLAARILARYSAKAWKMLAEEHAMPPLNRHLGREQIVTDVVRETQGGFLTGAQAREYAQSGVLAKPEGRLVGTGMFGPVTAPPHVTVHAPDQPVVTAEPPPALQPPKRRVTLSEAVGEGLFPSLPAVRQARHRNRDLFPDAIGRRGASYEYDFDELAVFAAGRREL